MLQQRRDQLFIPIVLGVIVLVVAIISIWGLVSQLTVAPVNQTTSTIQNAPVVQEANNVETASYLKNNLQASGLAENWYIYQASLNYADYPTTAYTALKLGLYDMDVPLVALTSGIDHPLLKPSVLHMDVPLVALTASIEDKLAD